MTPEQLSRWIWSRCKEDGDCLLWTGAKGSDNVPKMRLPGERKVYQARRVLMEALGRTIVGRIATTTCGNPMCMAEEHLTAYTRKQLQQRSAKKFSGTLARSAKLAEISRRNSRLTMEQVQGIRAQGMKADEVMERFGLSKAAAHSLIAGRTWKDYSNPFAGLMR